MSILIFTQRNRAVHLLRDIRVRHAIIFTLVESAKRHGLEPHAYLRELLHRLPEASNHEIPQLTPKAMAQAGARQKSAA